jgi:hypothetical protein
VVVPVNDFASVGTVQMSIGQFAGIHFGYREANTLYRKSAIVFERTDLTEPNAQGKVHILNGPQSGGGSATLSDARITIAENGYTGVGHRNPLAELHVSGSNSDPLLRVSSNASSSILFVTGSARVGINTSTPTSTFDIRGTAGQLFAVTDSLTGTVFSVNDISGVGILDAVAGATNVVNVYGELRATSEVTAYYSDERLKTKVGTFDDPLKIVRSLHGFKYINNDRAKDFGYREEKVQVGLSAQEVQRVLPEVVTLAPFDTIKNEDGTLVSRTGENYLTLDYAKLVPVLIEAIKKQQEQIDELKQLLTEK